MDEPILELVNAYSLYVIVGGMLVAYLAIVIGSMVVAFGKVR